MASPGFKGGDKMVKVLNEIARKSGGNSLLRVGFLESEPYPDGTSVAQVAFWNEYGTATSPPRPFFRNMIDQKKSGWGKKLGTALSLTGYDVNKAYGVMGDEIGNQLKQSIKETNAPALSSITVMLRGMLSNDQSLRVTGATVGEAAARVKAGKTNYGANDKPLQFTGQMKDAVAFDVKGT